MRRLALLAALLGCGRSGILDYGSPQLTLQPAVLDLGSALPNRTVEGDLILANVGRVKVTRIVLSVQGAGADRFEVQSIPSELEWGKSVTVHVVYHAMLPPQTHEVDAIVISKAPRVSAHLKAASIDPCKPAECGAEVGDQCHSAGHCLQGECVHDVLTGNPCDDQDRCTTFDLCAPTGACRGTPMICNSPPPPHCIH